MLLTGYHYIHQLGNILEPFLLDMFVCVSL